MKKLNQSLKLTVFVFLFTLPFLIGCAETDRVMRFPNLELPESATVSLDVPTGTEFKMLISTDYRKEKSNFGSTVITHEKEKVYSVTQDFRETIHFDSEEPRLSINLKCTESGFGSEEHPDSLRLIVQFNGDGYSSRGDHNKVYPFRLDTLIGIQTSFSRYDGISQRIRVSTESDESNFHW